MLAAGARRLLVPLAGVAEPLTADAARRLLRGTIRRGALRPFTVHAMGTARMSPDPARGVVSSFGELHGAPGVVVADASILPGPVGVNPMETIVALATRNAEHLVEHRAHHGI
jgi:choline dehydrogenase-like flavoprotein